MNKAKPKHIVLVTGIYPPKIGGPAHYALNLEKEYTRMGYKVTIVTYSKFDEKIPYFLRPLSIFIKVIINGFSADVLVSLDNCTLGLPAGLVAKIFHIPSVVRVGGDFLWESYIERNRAHVTLPDMYNDKVTLNFKEKIIKKFVGWSMKVYKVKIFNSDWLLKIWQEPYNLTLSECKVVLNYCGPLKISQINQTQNSSDLKVFLWSSRSLYLKNEAIMDKCFDEIKRTREDIVMEKFSGNQSDLHAKMDQCYAVLLPSISDVSPNLIYESVQRGKPFLVTKYTGLPDEFKKCGVFVDPFDANDIKRGINDLLIPEKYSYFKTNISEVWKENPWEKIANDLIKDLI